MLKQEPVEMIQIYSSVSVCERDSENMYILLLVYNRVFFYKNIFKPRWFSLISLISDQQLLLICFCALPNNSKFSSYFNFVIDPIILLQ